MEEEMMMTPEDMEAYVEDMGGVPTLYGDPMMDPAMTMDADVAMASAGIFAAMGFGFFLIWFAVMVLIIASMWKIFSKAGKPGWAAIIPIYNVIVLLEVAGKPVWWFLLMFIPFVNIVIAIIVSIELAKNFGKSAGYGIGLAFLGIIFYPMLAFGSAQYVGVQGGAAAAPPRRDDQYVDPDPAPEADSAPDFGGGSDSDAD